jgi:hypothetical protein
MCQNLHAALLSAQLTSLLYVLYPGSKTHESELAQNTVVLKFDRLKVIIAPRDANWTNGSVRLSSEHCQVDDYLPLTEWKLAETDLERICSFLQWQRSQEFNLMR